MDLLPKQWLADGKANTCALYKLNKKVFDDELRARHAEFEEKPLRGNTDRPSGFA